MKRIAQKTDLLVVFLLLLFSPLFFFKLGQSSLVSWDEAWYAEISRNILKTGELFNLSWSGQPYFDHPPAGFWLIALSFKLFGVSEFTARLMPALLGLLSIGVIYFLGKELFGRAVGLASAVALSSSFWFLFRARSGNLDTFLTFFFLLTLLLASRLAEQGKATQNKKYLLPFSFSLALLFLTKTLVPLTIIPALLIIFWPARSKFKLSDLKIPALVFLLLVGAWFGNQWQHTGFTSRIFEVGLPGVEAQSDVLANIENTKFLLHNGIGKWFWPGAFSIFAGLFLFQRRFYVLAAFFLAFAAPFAFSERGGIWHLIPLHPILILAFFGFAWVVLEKLREIVIARSPQATVAISKLLLVIPILALSAYISFIQIRRSWYEFIDIPAFTSDEDILSREAAKYPQELLIAGSDFRPAAVFYSGKNVPQMILGIRLAELFASDRSFLMITPESELENQGVPEDAYKILKKDRDKVLVLKE